mmetsp:Transcript_46528/g.77318  ORF Transcript_46528/g.77318 Transcript_46528/m.77318 type:complete len:785 (+) Transcript_46528:108-2462(+)
MVDSVDQKEIVPSIDVDVEQPSHDDDEHHEIDEYGNPVQVRLFGVTMSRDAAYYSVDLLCFVLSIASFVSVAVAVQWDAFVWRFYVGLGCFMIFCIVIAEVNHHNKFESMTASFNRWRFPLICTFFVLSIGDFILLQLSDVPDECEVWSSSNSQCPLLDPDDHGVRYMTRSFTIVCGALFVCCILAYWERISYLSAHNAFLTSMLYMTVIGAVFLYFARCLSPPPQRKEEQKYSWSWHQPHDTNQILCFITKFMVVVVLFFVIMGSIVLALFGDASRSSESLGTGAAMIIFIIFSHIIMITPLAPGSVVDVCAGFLFVSLLVNNEGFSIEQAYFISLALTIALHFSGSCCQYFVGKIGAVQIWANKTLPPEMLAASDTVLKTANWFKVGVVGQVFMDTANGLNQGRMDMNFCTQFWSEYASIPNALGLVSLGTILAVSSFGDATIKRYEWLEDAIPLVFMITSLWQMMASSYGAKELLSSSGTVPYWTALEKWYSVQWFYNRGYVPTKQGWQQDVYRLGSAASKHPPPQEKDADGDEAIDMEPAVQVNMAENQPLSLFESIHQFRLSNMSKSHVISTSEEFRGDDDDDMSFLQFCRNRCRRKAEPIFQRRRMVEEKKLSEQSIALRQQHWQSLQQQLDELVQRKQLINVPSKIDIENYFTDSEGIKLYAHYAITASIFLTGMGAYFYISKNISLTLAVSTGLSALQSNNVSSIGWISLLLFWLLVIAYFHRECKDNLMQCRSNLSFVCNGCKHADGYDRSDMETVFNTPIWRSVDTDSSTSTEI